jgi:hypothetical protein
MGGALACPSHCNIARARQADYGKMTEGETPSGNAFPAHQIEHQPCKGWAVYSI